MGADLIMTGLVIPVGREPDWDAGAKWINEATAEELERAADTLCWDELLLEDDAEMHKAIRTRLHDLLDELRKTIEQHGRDLDWFTIAGHKLYVTGGMSWGDSPTDAFDTLSYADQVGIAEVCGFSVAQTPVESITAIVAYNRQDEELDYQRMKDEGEDVSNHAFVHLENIEAWLEEVTEKAPT